MSLSLPVSLARPLIRLWLAHSPHSWQRGVIAGDSPHVHARGVNPHRLFITGDGMATGRGVLTHDLGLPGHLARSLTARTGHATDVDIAVDQTMTVDTCLQAMAETDLSRYDVIVLSLGCNEALALMELAAWRASLKPLLTRIEERAPAAKIIVLPIPLFGPHTVLPAVLVELVDERVAELNAVTLDLAAAQAGVTLVGDGDTYDFREQDSHVYRVWANSVAESIHALLDPDRALAGSTADVDERDRLRALERVHGAMAVGDLVLDGLTRRARQAFGTTIGVITLIHHDVQIMISTVGMEPEVVPREQTFCDVTIRRAGHLVIEDASRDARYQDFPAVTGSAGVKFYAGYPIESPDGHRVGALSVMDDKPRHLTPDDLALLRSLAQAVQRHVWQTLPA